MSTQISRVELVHRRGVMAACILVCFTIAVVAIIQVTGTGKRYEPQTEAIASATLFFHDEPEGVVAVVDAETGTRLMEYGQDEGVFVRSVMRGIARQRRMRGMGPEVPVELTHREDGQLWLHDPTNGIDIYLGAFGPDNHSAFAEILEREQQIAANTAAGDQS